jgi:hypothetical protein
VSSDKLRAEDTFFESVTVGCVGTKEYEMSAQKEQLTIRHTNWVTKAKSAGEI